MFRFQEDDEKKARPLSMGAGEAPQPIVEEEVQDDEEDDQQGGVKEVNLGDSGTVLLPDPEVTPKVPATVVRIPVVHSPGLTMPRRVGPVLLDADGGVDASGKAAEPRDVMFSVYSSSMPIQVPLLEEDYLDLRKRAKRALVMQAYGRAAHPARSQSTNNSANLEGTDLPDPPLSQSFAVPSSLSLRNPFRPE